MANILKAGKPGGDIILEINHHHKELQGLDPLQDFDQALAIFTKWYAVREAQYMANETGVARGIPPWTFDPFAPDEGGYAGVALNFMDIERSGKADAMILTVPNEGAVDFLLDTDTVEVTCDISSEGCKPRQFTQVPDDQKELIRRVKYYERMGAYALIHRDRKAAVKALMLHPLVNSFSLATTLTNAYIELNAPHRRMAWIRNDLSPALAPPMWTCCIPACPGCPQEGEEIYTQDFSVQLGGGYPATLINLSRLNVPVRIQTFLGEDLFSRFAVSQYVQNRIMPLNLYVGTRIPVNVTSAVITPRDRAFTSYTDPVAVLDSHREQVFEASQGAAIALVHECCLPIYQELKREGTLLVYDTGWSEDMHLSNMEEVIELVDFYTPNHMEAMRITDTDSPSAAARRLADYLPHVIHQAGQGLPAVFRRSGKP